MIPNYLEQLISEVPHNSTVRYDCPVCRGKSTLGITKDNGTVKWNCFKCKKESKPSGKNRYMRTQADLKSQQTGLIDVEQVFRLPEHLIHGLSSSKAVQMISKGNCLEPYKSGLFDVAYDPIQDRICFIVKEGTEIIGLIGKAFDRNTKPKVLNYPNSNVDVPFVVGKGKTLVLVEDCLSAASVARMSQLTGLALLGTTLRDSYIDIIKKYDKVIVALDRDARIKALAIKKKLGYYHSNVGLWLLDKDIKDMTDEEFIIAIAKSEGK